MNEIGSFELHPLDYVAFAAYFVVLCGIGFWASRQRRAGSEDYFLAGRSLPWYVVGTSFIASNISTEHFIGMIGATFLFGISIAMYEWGNINAFSVLIWLFIPFLLATRVFTTPEFLERRFNNFLRQSFAVMTVICNVLAFLAAVLYGGGLALHQLFGWPLGVAIVVLGVVAGSWAIVGGLRSVAWTDCFTVIVMVAGGLMVTVLGLKMLSGETHSLVEGFRVMIDRNRADHGIWAEVVARHAREIVARDHYDRLSVIQPATHQVVPWPSLVYGFLASGIWYSVLNQFMIQRVLGARNMYHARMGIVLAGYLKVLMPALVVLPGMILFAWMPEMMNQPWADIKPDADRGYIMMLQALVPIGLRGLFLAALFGAIQSTVNSVLNSTATIVTLDIYQRMWRPRAEEKQLVRVGMICSVVVLVVAMVLAGYIDRLGQSLFVYIQSLYAFFAPPFSAVFLLGILFRRINAKGASAAVVLGFGFGILLKLYLNVWPDLFGAQVYDLVRPFSNQSFLHWGFSVAVCAVVSLVTPPPRPEQVTDQLTFNWRRLNIFQELGDRWYQNVALWWGLFALLVIGLMVLFSGAVVAA